VRAAATVFPLPFSGAQQNIGIALEGQTNLRDLPSANYRGVTPDYFRAMGIPLLRGRVFNEGDVADRPRVVIVNDTMARTMWPGRDAIGQRFRIMSGPQPRPYFEVVGIVGDVKHQSLDAASGPEMYVSYYQKPQHRTAFLVLALDGEQRHVAGALRGAVGPVEDIATMDELVSKSLAPRRFYMVLLGLFAALAITLAAVGIYGVVAYQVAERTREIGVRIAIGARPRAVQNMVLGQALRLTAIGTVAGLAGALALSRVLAGFLYGVKTSDPLTYVVVVLFLLAVAGAAAWLPARRAARIDPIAALRCN
jgi:putative ABC transport system permease protein